MAIAAFFFIREIPDIIEQVKDQCEQGEFNSKDKEYTIFKHVLSKFTEKDCEEIEIDLKYELEFIGTVVLITLGVLCIFNIVGFLFVLMLGKGCPNLQHLCDGCCGNENDDINGWLKWVFFILNIFMVAFTITYEYFVFKYVDGVG